MKAIIHTYPLSSNGLYKKIYSAIQREKNNTGRKPSLVQISRRDYQDIITTATSKAALGLSIDNVTVISFDDMEQGSFYFLP